MNMLESAHQVFIAVDQLLNALFRGYADETLSARCHRRNHKTKWAFFEKVVNVIFFWQRIDGKMAHCEIAMASEMKRHHLPHEYRD